ncbi:MAG TPA: FtsX-like permease family protein [Acidimicrobiia bacterium]|nr:FtsX-like permease family protein [Acidimicrobiia bacterium]
MSGRRSAFGVAFKNARRNKKRTFYLVLLISIPVTVAVMTSVFVTAGYVSPEESVTSQFGQANLIIEKSGDSSELDAWIEATVTDLAPDAERLEFRADYQTFAPRTWGRVIDVDLDDPLTEGIIGLVEGRSPQTPREVVLTEHLASVFAVGVGDSVELEGRSGTVRFEVVGLASHPIYWEQNEAIITPDGMDMFRSELNNARLLMLKVDDDLGFSQGYAQAWDRARYDFYPGDRDWPMPPSYWFLPDVYYADMSDAELAEMDRLITEEGDDSAMAYMESLFPNGVDFSLPETYAQSRTELLMWNQRSFTEIGPVIGTGVAALILAEVAFIAGAAFATGTRRRLREIGLLAANGASTKHVRSTVVGEGLVIGLLGGLFGSALALLLVVFGRSTIQQFVIRRIDEFPFSLTDIAGPILVAVIACVVAAWVPARTASGVPTLTALQGRMPVGRPKRWIIPFGLGVGAFGVLLLAVGLAGGSSGAATVAVIGAILMIGGAGLLAGPMVAWISKHSERFPITPRIVLRDSGRQRGRAAAAVAATMVIMMAPVAALATIEHNEANEAILGLAPDRSQIVISGTNTDTGEKMDLSDADLARVENLVPVASMATFEVIDAPIKYPAELAAVRDPDPDVDWGGHYFSPWRMAVAGDELLAFLDDARLEEALERDGMALIGVEERTNEIEIAGSVTEIAEVPIAVQQWSFPRVLVTEETAADYATFETRPNSVIEIEETWLQSLNPFHEPARPLWETSWGTDASLEMSGGGGADVSSGVVVALVTLATMLIVLIVVAAITALSAAEADSDLQTVVAVGAANSIRRKYLGLQSGIHTLLGALLAIPLTLVLMKTVYSSDAITGGWSQVGNFAVFDATVLHVPWMGIAVMLVVLPLAIGLVTALTVRSAPTTPPHRAT